MARAVVMVRPTRTFALPTDAASVSEDAYRSGAQRDVRGTLGYDMPSLVDREDLIGSLFFPRADTAPAPRGAIDHQVEVPGATLHVREHPARDARGRTLLLFHGNGEIVADWDPAAAAFVKRGVRFLVVDYRGYGRSTGVPTMGRLLDDALAVLDFVAARTTGRLAIMGRSLGSAAAWEVAADPRVSGVIIDSGFVDVDAFARRRGIDPATLTAEERARLDPLPKIARVTRPILLLHGELDAVIAHREAEVALASAHDARLVTIAGRGHNDLSYGAAYWPALASALDAL